MEDKIVQRAVVEVLNAVYEEDFLGFSYGFRPGRRPHDALDALAVALERRRVNWMLDADIRDFFTQLDQGWLERFLEHRIADKRILRLIQKWLRAGVIEEGEWSETEAGTAQGASVSPLLSNVFLHYVFDLWADQWRRRRARGDVVLVRFADDCVPRALKEDRCRRRYRRMRCCTRDEGARPVGLVALRGRPAGGGRKPPRGAPVKSRGAERRGKGALSARQVWITKASESDTTDEVSKAYRRHQNRGRVVAPGSAWREPADWPGGVRHEWWRERGSGSGAELGNLSPRWDGWPVERSGPAAGRLEREPQAADLRGGE